jgi:hypothetical protein
VFTDAQTFLRSRPAYTTFIEHTFYTEQPLPKSPAVATNTWAKQRARSQIAVLSRLMSLNKIGATNLTTSYHRSCHHAGAKARRVGRSEICVHVHTLVSSSCGVCDGTALQDGNIHPQLPGLAVILTTDNST